MGGDSSKAIDWGYGVATSGDASSALPSVRFDFASHPHTLFARLWHTVSCCACSDAHRA